MAKRPSGGEDRSWMLRPDRGYRTGDRAGLSDAYGSGFAATWTRWCAVPYALMSDQFARDPVWYALGADEAAAAAVGKAARARPSGGLIDALQAAYVRLSTEASHQRTDGYFTAEQALEECRGVPRVLELLTARVLDREPLLHKAGDKCACLGDEWVDGYAYRIHAFLKRNPARVETERHRAQQADLRDARLRTLVYDRDGGCCRYCRSGPLSAKAVRSRDRRKVLCFDHVDPDRPAGPDGDNLVTACGACNEHKGHRTPDEADMVLLPVPAPEEAAAWSTSDQVLYTRSTSGIDHRRITAGSATDHRSDADRDREHSSDRDGDPIGDRTADPGDIGTGSARPLAADQAPDQAQRWSGKPPGMGRDGQPADPLVIQPARDPAYPDVYHRRSRSPGRPP